LQPGVAVRPLEIKDIIDTLTRRLTHHRARAFVDWAGTALPTVSPRLHDSRREVK
jgi:hypothetical protein